MGVDRCQMARELVEAQNCQRTFEAERFVNRWPARTHDHFLIPAGTIHCSGANSMVLEISATPYIFTFKLWDWGRLGLDGRSRPIHLNHGLANIQWDRDTEWVKANLLNKVEPIAQGAGWIEERTGLHVREFIETRRHEAALIESPADSFAPFEVHYADTFIVPANVRQYTVRPVKTQSRCVTIRASVRT